MPKWIVRLRDGGTVVFDNDSVTYPERQGECLIFHRELQEDEKPNHDQASESEITNPGVDPDTVDEVIVAIFAPGEWICAYLHEETLKTVFGYIDVLKLIVEGYKARRKTWGAGDYIRYDSSYDHFIDENGIELKNFSADFLTADDWEYFK
jgi:hypothetical protein